MNSNKLTIFLLLISLISITPEASGADNPQPKKRVLILTDIENEPDDAQSLVRFLLYSNQWDVEGLIATTSCWLRDTTAAWRIEEIVKAYGKVQPALLVHEQGYPSEEQLLDVIKSGYPGFGMEAVGKGFDSEGSEHIIDVLQKDDDRPVWIPVWGGANCLAQALWKLKHTLEQPELDKIIRKIRVYTISDQDNAGPWLRNTFHDLFYIVSPGYHENGADGYYYATWTGISGERHYNFPAGADNYIIDNEWVDINIQEGHGPLGKQYPDIAYIMEGDTPSFLYLVENGLGSPENPDWGSWGGRYESYIPNTQLYYHEPEERPIWTNARDWVETDGTVYINEQATIWRWRTHFQNDFAARMDWCISDYQSANHPPEARLAHDNELILKPGETFTLDASPSGDPDNNQLSYSWIHYREAGTWSAWVHPSSPQEAKSTVTMPQVSEKQVLHYIVAVTDNGQPALTRYQRVVITVNPGR